VTTDSAVIGPDHADSVVVKFQFGRTGRSHLLDPKGEFDRWDGGQGTRRMQQRNYILEALAQARTRQSWNDRLAHWERPASDSEEAMIGRATTMVRQMMSGNQWFASEAVEIAPQGSYYNNTNVRQESDIDLRAVHRDIFIQYASAVLESRAYAALGYFNTGRTYTDLVARLRLEMAVELGRKFGALNVDASGKKAIRVHGIPGSRADVDIVPCFTLHHVRWNAIMDQYWTTKGIAILSQDGRWTFNFPEQHYENGVQKRAGTRLRFKKIVRMLKRLRDELVETGVLEAKEVPSFLIECLVYGVEDQFFLVEEDDRYDRLLRVVTRMYGQLHDQAWCAVATEINGVELLFGEEQAWTVDGARRFVVAAWERLSA
jgi:hypothetical protein